MQTGNTTVLRDHHLVHGVVEIVARAERSVVLVSPYLDVWANLETAIRSAVRRGVSVHLVTRVPDGTKRESGKSAKATDTLRDAGVRIDQVKRLHAKLYANESEVIMTSMNLVAASRDSVELGLHTRDREILDACLQFVSDLLPPAPEPATSPELAVGQAATRLVGQGFCIGCASPSQAFDVEKPLCKLCYKSSERGTALRELPKRVCHSCGHEHTATLGRPVCLTCYRVLNLNPTKSKRKSTDRW